MRKVAHDDAVIREWEIFHRETAMNSTCSINMIEMQKEIRRSTPRLLLLLKILQNYSPEKKRIFPSHITEIYVAIFFILDPLCKYTPRRINIIPSMFSYTICFAPDDSHKRLVKEAPQMSLKYSPHLSFILK